MRKEIILKKANKSESKRKQEKHRIWREQNRLYIRKYHARKYRELKDFIFSLLGRKCKFCSTSDLRVLQIDHVEDDGYKEHQLMGTGWQYLRQVLKTIQLGSNRYQLLCANCNVIKRLETKKIKGGTR